MMGNSPYSMDTSSLIDGLERYYPEETFPGLWERVDQLIEAGRFLLSDEVWEEVQRKDAVVKAWGEQRKEKIVVATDPDVVAAVRVVLNGYPLLVKNMKGRNRADAFVIAVAQVRGGVVVTGEGSDGTEARPKIPFICQQLGVPCVRLLDLIRAEGWQFNA